MSTVSFIRGMVDAGFSYEEALKAAEVFEANQPLKQRSSAAIRQERYRRNKALRVTDCDGGDGFLSPEGSSPTPPSPKPQSSLPPSPPKGGSSPTPNDELSAVLDADHVRAVLDHRQKIRKPLTAHAAKLLAGKFRRCPDPNAAADAMIANGWQGFEPEWLENRNMQRGQPPPRLSHHQQRHQDALKAADKFLGINDDEPEFAGSTFDLDPGDFRSH